MAAREDWARKILLGLAEDYRALFGRGLPSAQARYEALSLLSQELPSIHQELRRAYEAEDMGLLLQAATISEDVMVLEIPDEIHSTDVSVNLPASAEISFASSELTSEEKPTFVGVLPNSQSAVEFASNVSLPNPPVVDSPRLKSASPLSKVEGTKPKAAAPIRKSSSDGNTVDMFSEEQVMGWSRTRIDAWRARHENANAFYYRFVDPTIGQANGVFTRTEHEQFMRRYEEYQENGWPLGSDWGLFSQMIPHKVGYQCSAYYRKLVKEGRLKDSSFERDEKTGDLKKREGERGRGRTSLANCLSSLWESDLVRGIEQSVNGWIRQYHGLELGSTGDILRADDAAQIARSARVARPVAFERPATSLPVAKVRSMPSTFRGYALVRKGKARQTGDRSTGAAAAVASEVGERHLDLGAYLRGKVSVVRVQSAQGRTDSEIEFVKLPADVKRSWAIPIRNLRDMESCRMGGRYLETNGGLQGVCELLSTLEPVEALILNPPWSGPSWDPSFDGFEPSNLAPLPINGRLMPRGMLMIWVEKHHLPAVVELAASWGFVYVENVVWVRMGIDNKKIELEYRYVRKSKLSLLLFRKEGALELRHQRSADVVFDFEGADALARPHYVYEAIETLLPESRGRMLEVWSPRNFRRANWTTVHVMT